MSSKFPRALFAGLFVLLITGCHSTSPEQEALDFLYAYMPLPDSVDYPREFWERNVEAALQARREMPWGKKVPEREWRHFVLPVRVNNENLDDARTILYNELKERVRNLSMQEAVLEVNHWCHEHVTYQPSDGRTSSPLATVRSAIGRCGEESTLTVAALRAVGIPARQVYTPRWAHTDDNHAWVEAWADGQWYFMGACEPEPVLNLGWFNAPASRGILMHTKAFGNYDGPEEVMSRTACYTEINVTENYCPVSLLNVQVSDTQGNPVPKARVDFRVYNYAEFYNLVSKTADEEGRADLTCGRGDLLVWASHKGRFGFAKASVGKDSLVTVVLDKLPGYTASLDLDLIPPAEHPVIPEMTEEQQAENKLRLAREDSIRQAYMDSAFYNSSITGGEGAGSSFLIKARANHPVISEFLQKYPEGEALLSTLRSKDFRDVTAEVLEDHWNCSHSSGTLNSYILSPRVSNEMLTPWRSTLSKAFKDKSAQDIIQWTRDSILTDETRNPQHLCMSPLGVFRHRQTDAHSRDIFFVCAMRSAGIPARIDEVTGKVQYIAAGPSSAWTDVDFSEDNRQQTADNRGKLLLSPSSKGKQGGDRLPDYFSHYSLALLTDNCDLQLQDYEMQPQAVNAFFGEGMTMDTGTYLLTTGTRLANGGVLAHLEFFCVPKDNTVSIPLYVRHDTEELQVIGSFNSELRYTPLSALSSETSVLSTTGRGYFVIGFLRPGEEPTNHALRDIAAVSKQLEAWGRSIILFLPEGTDLQALLSRPEFQGLPSTVSFGTLSADQEKQVLNASRLPLSNGRPLFLMADTFNRVVWYSQGYTIGLGEQLIKVIGKL